MGSELKIIKISEDSEIYEKYKNIFYNGIPSEFLYLAKFYKRSVKDSTTKQTNFTLNIIKNVDLKDNIYLSFPDFKYTDYIILKNGFLYIFQLYGHPDSDWLDNFLILVEKMNYNYKTVFEFMMI